MSNTQINKDKNPCHAEFVPALNRVSGQILGVKNMVKERRYCPEILQQLRAARSAIRSLELKILDKHINQCLSEAFTENNAKMQQEKISEICQLIKKF